MRTRWYLVEEYLPHPEQIVLIGFIDGTVSLGTYSCSNYNKIVWFSCGSSKGKTKEEYEKWFNELRKLNVEPKYWIHLPPVFSTSVMD